MKDLLNRFLNGDTDLYGSLPSPRETHDASREDWLTFKDDEAHRIDELPETKRIADSGRRMFRRLYVAAALFCCLTLALVLLYMTANITAYGYENPRTETVAKRYIEKGVEETGAVNAVAGMILDYRAFDTLGESHVLFTALVIVMLLLKLDSRNTRSRYEDYYRTPQERYYPTEKDPILRRVAMVLGGCILLFAVYVLLNGHIGPGGGFSGGAVLGSGLIILASGLGDETVSRVLTERRFHLTAFLSLSFYSFAKGYVFFTGANGIENRIPKGTPGAILSAGLILPLNIVVGLVVGCTMYGFYTLLRRGTFGGGISDD